MSISKKERSPVPVQFMQSLAARAEIEPRFIPADMDFPTLEEMEMDAPLTGLHMLEERELPEDDSNLDMDCLRLVNPTLSVSSLSL